MPDQRLFELANSNELLKDEVLASEVERMLSDQRAERFIEQFTDQWLQLDRLDSIAVDLKRYPTFNEQLKTAFRKQTHALFARILNENTSVLQLIDSDIVMLNERLARHYGIPGVMGSKMRPVKVEAGHHRGGLVTHARRERRPVPWLLHRAPACPPHAGEAGERAREGQGRLYGGVQ